MAENRDAKQATHRAYSVTKREGQDDFWLNLGLVFPHKDGSGFNIMLQVLPQSGRYHRAPRNVGLGGLPSAFLSH
jgi:hypothetical protein